jgi:transcriptional regulator of acetoin/glycerol metabolism
MRYNMESQWENFVVFGKESNHVRKPVMDSWIRCRQVGLTPDSHPRLHYLEKEKFIERKQKNYLLIEAAVPIMKEIYDHLNGEGYQIVLVDKEGYLLEVFSDDKAKKALQEVSMAAGARWMEESIGTTGLTLAINTRAPMVTSGMEHYFFIFRSWDCAACPIYVDGEFYGVFDVCRLGAKENLKELLSLAVTSAKAVGERIQLLKAKVRETTLSHILNTAMDLESRKMGLLAVDIEGKVIYQNHMTHNLMHSLQKDFNDHMDQPTPFVEFLLEETKVGNKEFIIESSRGKNVVKTHKIKINDAWVSTVFLFQFQTEFHSFYSKATHEATSSSIMTNFPTQNKIFRETLNMAMKASRSDACILIQGESGTGKDFMAKAIHEESQRSKYPFVAINCAALPRDLIVAELFGYAPGAFTGANKNGNPGKIEVAHGGTVFLDEIGDMPLDLQVVFLRVLEDKHVCKIGSSQLTPIDVRFIAASHKNLKDLVKRGLFRDDLLYRLNIFPLYMPPLRERIEDLKLILDNMMVKACLQVKRQPIYITSEAMKILEDYDWPGNLRELRNFVERVVHLHEGNTLNGMEAVQYLDDRDTKFGEKDYLLEVLRKYKGNKAKAAKEIGISRTALYRKLGKYGILDIC